MMFLSAKPAAYQHDKAVTNYSCYIKVTLFHELNNRNRAQDYFAHNFKSSQITPRGLNDLNNNNNPLNNYICNNNICRKQNKFNAQ